MKKRILAIVLALAMLLPAFAVGSLAATPEEEATALLDQTRAVLNSGKYTLKARGTSPFNGKMTPIAYVSDGNRTMFEATMDWAGMLQEMSGDKVSSMLYGGIMQLFFGKKVRFITDQDQAMIVFVNRRTYIDVPETPDSLDISAMFSGPEMTGMTVSEPVIGGKKYLCAALSGDNDVTTRYYYLNGALKRITLTVDAEEIAFEIDLLSPTVDESYFSTKWMLKLSVLSGLLPF